jgi:hypothetical protein
MRLGEKRRMTAQTCRLAPPPPLGIRAALEDRPDFAARELDLKNAFNEFSRALLTREISRFRDFWRALPRRSRGQTRATRGEITTRHKGNWRVPCSCLCVETPAVAHGCFALPRLPTGAYISLTGKLMR